jgi:hypothetical protein
MDGWGLPICELEDEEKSNVILQTLAQSDRVPGPAFRLSLGLCKPFIAAGRENGKNNVTIMQG